MTIKIDKELFQWERGREVLVEFDDDKPIAPFAQFFNCKTAIAPYSPILNGRATIPDTLLEVACPIMVLICTEEKVLCRKEFKVLKRPKPEGYDELYSALLKLDLLIGGDI